MNSNTSGLNIDNSYTRLNGQLFTTIKPTPDNNQYQLLKLNSSLAASLKLNKEYLNSKEGLFFLSGKKANKYAQAYGGHQFGHFSILGDGRAAMIAEHKIDDLNRVDLQLKGSGITPYSRRGDGKATLISILREYLVSEAMNSLNIPTTRSLAVLRTGETVQREIEHEGAILVRTAKSHIRVGTFQYASTLGDNKVLKELTDYTIKRHYPNIFNSKNRYSLFLDEVVRKQAKLIAKWQGVGFVHGVMNTDNVLVSGETIDYGPCAFIDRYNPDAVFSSIDSSGRYAYKAQPFIASWNMARFAESILPLLDNKQDEAVKKANQSLQKFEEIYNKEWLHIFSNKLGILSPNLEDKKLIDSLLDIMEKNNLDFTNTFKNLTLRNYKSIAIKENKLFDLWRKEWLQRIEEYPLNQVKKVMMNHNPVIIPRNHIVQKALELAAFNDSFMHFDTLMDLLSNPFDYSMIIPESYLSNSEDNEPFVTYCGT